ncbi:uncharacterized protein TrAFT101_001505 [Trichoderma asperellum]|uniref:uncharacterized protein n=1 Tax=Trichoderma asperellum TaxID=101201 RepID=UPI0033196306|nr:hypothetical protein TrAFT101_001505 [Trichoderma asperellum]
MEVEKLMAAQTGRPTCFNLISQVKPLPKPPFCSLPFLRRRAETPLAAIRGSGSWEVVVGRGLSVGMSRVLGSLLGF